MLKPLQLPFQSLPVAEIINNGQQPGGVGIGRLSHHVRQLRRAETLYRTRFFSRERQMQTPLQFIVDEHDKFSIRFGLQCFWQLHLAQFGSLIWPTLSR